MQRKAEDHKEHEQLRGCFYRGRIRTDEKSAVAVSLCDGMVSNTIFTSFSINTEYNNRSRFHEKFR